MHRAGAQRAQHARGGLAHSRSVVRESEAEREICRVNQDKPLVSLPPAQHSSAFTEPHDGGKKDNSPREPPGKAPCPEI